MKYICTNCKEEWEIEGNVKPELCSLCDMPIMQAFRNIWAVEGFWGAVKFIIKNRL